MYFLYVHKNVFNIYEFALCILSVYIEEFVSKAAESREIMMVEILGLEFTCLL